MSNKKEQERQELFFPYYINQERLLDIYAILNGGYSEFEEITTASSKDTSKKGKTDIKADGGFKLFKFGGNVSGELEKHTGNNDEAKERKVQTVTSVLSLVKNTLEKTNRIHEITQSKPGQFVCLPVNLSINSVKSLLNELSEITKLANSLMLLGANDNQEKKQINAENKQTVKQIEELEKTAKELFEGEEIFFETKEYVIIGNIVDKNLYQSVRADIIGTELFCLAQVKRVFLDGTELMKNTTFSKFKDKDAKQEFINSIKGLSDNDAFDFEAVIIPSIDNKPVYQLEIIALYQ